VVRDLKPEHIVYHIEEYNTARHATTLFSWADQLAVAGDPVYAAFGT
jgi:nuclear pore complex protein Nup188